MYRCLTLYFFRNCSSLPPDAAQNPRPQISALLTVRPASDSSSDGLQHAPRGLQNGIDLYPKPLIEQRSPVQPYRHHFRLGKAGKRRAAKPRPSSGFLRLMREHQVKKDVFPEPLKQQPSDARFAMTTTNQTKHLRRVLSQPSPRPKCCTPIDPTTERSTGKTRSRPTAWALNFGSW